MPFGRRPRRRLDASLRDGLNTALARRDLVTSGLAKADPATAETLGAIGLDLRRALAYELPPAAGMRVAGPCGQEPLGTSARRWYGSEME